MPIVGISHVLRPQGYALHLRLLTRNLDTSVSCAPNVISERLQMSEVWRWFRKLSRPTNLCEVRSNFRRIAGNNVGNTNTSRHSFRVRERDGCVPAARVQTQTEGSSEAGVPSSILFAMQWRKRFLSPHYLLYSGEASCCRTARYQFIDFAHTSSSGLNGGGIYLRRAALFAVLNRSFFCRFVVFQLAKILCDAPRAGGQCAGGARNGDSSFGTERTFCVARLATRVSALPRPLCRATRSVRVASATVSSTRGPCYKTFHCTASRYPLSDERGQRQRTRLHDVEGDSV